MYAKFIPISAMESFVLFPFTGDYLNLEMFKIFYLLGVYQKDVYFCMIISFVFFFERSMQIPIKILKAPFRIKKLIILPLVIYMVPDYSFFDSTADFVIKKGTFGIFTGFGHLQISETSGRNMTVELDSRHPLLPKTGWENENLTLILRGKNEIFCRYQCFQC